MKKLKMGMVGGGIGAFIGDVHRKAAAFDGKIELVCGVFSSNPEKSRKSAEQLGLPPDRSYESFEKMIEKESMLPKGERMDFISIVTPNHLHFPPAKMALEKGFHVMCDKPMTLTLEEAYDLVKLVKKTGKVFGLTHTYTGYPMVRQAKEMVKRGDLGEIRKVVVNYLQGWMSTQEYIDANESAWRSDPKKSGIGGSLGDVGTHAANMVEEITGLRISEIAADLTGFGKNRILDDDGNLLLRLENGAKGVMSYSQVATGDENAFSIRVYGTKGSVEWHQERPTELIAKWVDAPKQTFTPGGNGTYAESTAFTRVPPGHPEGYFEAFATLYNNFAKEVMSVEAGNPISKEVEFPTVEDGLRGMQFIYAAVASSENNASWVSLKE
ncbi:MAG: oxidoreductase [Cytophagaceae bacterium]|nr:oxidoreductase [Cytophagaceae bacterium]|tara:strand:- start:17569 stop:18717 length:1149 start_codon:yes stop_codon:yes gene_type:complete